MYNQERAVVYKGIGGNPMETYSQMQQYNDQKAERERLLAQKQQERDDSLMKWAADQLDFKNFATGTQLDPVINTSLGNLLKDTAAKIKADPNMSMANLLYGIQDGVGRVTAYSQKAKNIRAGAEKMIGEWSKNPSIDGSKLLKGALSSAFMKVDPQTGALVPKSAEEIDERTDYVSNYLQTKPEEVITGTQYLYETLGKQKGVKVGDIVQETDARRGMNKFKYSGELMPWQQISFERGKDGLNRAVPKVKTQEVEIPGIGKMPVLDEGVYGQIFGDAGNSLILEAQLNRMDKDRKLTPQQREMLKRGLAAELVGGANVGGGIVNENVEKEQPILVRNNTTINTGGTPPVVNDVFGSIRKKAMASKQKGRGFLQTNLLDANEQDAVLDAVNGVAKFNTGQTDNAGNPIMRDYTNADVVIIYDEDGLGVYKAERGPDGKTVNKVPKKGNLITRLNYVGTNLPEQANTKAKAEVVARGNQGGTPQTKQNTSNDWRNRAKAVKQ